MWKGVLICKEGGGLRNRKAFLPGSGRPTGSGLAALRDAETRTPDG